MTYIKPWLPLILYACLVIVIVLLVPESVYYSKRRDKVEADMLILVIVFILPVIFVPFFYPKKFVRYLAGFITLAAAGFFSATYYRENKIDNEFKKYAISEMGIVIKERYERAHRGSGNWAFKCEFEYKNIKYRTYYHPDYDDMINVGDSLQILFLARNPEISKVNF